MLSSSPLHVRACLHRWRGTCGWNSTCFLFVQFSFSPVLQMLKGGHWRVPRVRASERREHHLLFKMWSTITYITTWSSGWTKKAIDCRADRRRNSCSGTTTRWRVAGNLVMGRRIWWSMYNGEVCVCLSRKSDQICLTPPPFFSKSFCPNLF